DDAYAQAVMEVFVALHRKGYIFRGNRIVNWCPSCGSAISDLEVRYEHAADTLYEVRYAIAGSNEFVAVATVRPETILADTAVAGELEGLTAAEARARVIDRLFALGLLKDEEPYEPEVGHCDRSGDRIAPLISLQWFCDMESLATPAIAAVREGRVRFHPRS